MTVISDLKIQTDTGRRKIVDVETTNEWQWVVMHSVPGILISRAVATNVGEDNNDMDVIVRYTAFDATDDQGEPISPGGDAATEPWEDHDSADDVSDGASADSEKRALVGGFAIGVKSSLDDNHTTARIVIRGVR